MKIKIYQKFNEFEKKKYTTTPKFGCKFYTIWLKFYTKSI